MKIEKVYAREILDSRGNPTVEATIELENGIKAKAMVPSGASTGTHEVIELRDGDQKRYGGKGVLKAVANVNGEINAKLSGMEVTNQQEIDNEIIKLDGTVNKGRLGGNAILAVSMAVSRAGALSTDTKLYKYIHSLCCENSEMIMPRPMINVLNGGKHAISGVDMQEFMIVPINQPTIAERVRVGSEVFMQLGKNLRRDGFITTVGDEGGYAPSFSKNEDALKTIVEAIKDAGYNPGVDVSIALDPAASEFYENGRYNLKADGLSLSSDELLNIYNEWVNKYPIISIEDPFAEDDWEAFTKTTNLLGNKIQIVGDDLLVTNVQRLSKAIELKSCNSILIKLNQIGTVSEAIDAVKKAKSVGMKTIISHRSGETEDTFIADFAVGTVAAQIKTGSMSRSERVAKYNRLMEIEIELQSV